MFTSDKNLNRAFLYTSLTAFFALFGAVYETFSHEVYSFFMIYAFAVPLLLGVFPSLLIIQSGWRVKSFVGQIYGSGVIALTLSCILKGALDIYGTANSKLPVMPLLGIIMILLSVLLSLPIFKQPSVSQKSKLT